jgi:Tfp pilus assembly protein PilF
MAITRRGAIPALFSLMLLAAGTVLLGLAGCGAGPSKQLAGRDEAERLALADRGTFDVSRPPPEAPPQRVASFRSAAEGRAALQKGDMAAAEDLLERALGLDPANPFSYLYLADVRVRQGDPRQALVFLDKAEIHFRGHRYWLGEVYARKGLCWEKLGSPDEARKAYRKALESDPSNRAAREGLGRLGNDAEKMQGAG